jgi:hypothetical protein
MRHRKAAASHPSPDLAAAFGPDVQSVSQLFERNQKASRSSPGSLRGALSDGLVFLHSSPHKQKANALADELPARS